MLKESDKSTFSQKKASPFFTFYSVNCQLPHLRSAIFCLALFCFLQPHSSHAQSQTAPESPYIAQKSKTKTPPHRNARKKRTQIEWYGRSFIYITTSTGVRIAINPFPADIPGYQFPHGIAADVILISDSNRPNDGAEMISGNPRIFRGPVAVGFNKASGIIFQGISTRQHPFSSSASHNTLFHFSIDGMKFVHTGSLGHPLSQQQLNMIDRTDILFLAVGNRKLSLNDIDKIIYDLDPAIVVPIEYSLRTEDRLANLRPLQPFIENEKHIVTFKEHGFLIGSDLLPNKTTIVILNPPEFVNQLQP